MSSGNTKDQIPTWSAKRFNAKFESHLARRPGTSGIFHSLALCLDHWPLWANLSRILTTLATAPAGRLQSFCTNGLVRLLVESSVGQPGGSADGIVASGSDTGD